MKKLNFALLLAMLICVGGVKSYAHDIAVANADGVTIYYNFINNQTELAVTYQGNSSGNADYTGKVVIPTSVTYEGKTYSVTSIGNNAFSGCTSLTEVTIPNQVKSIGGNPYSSPFSGCRSLERITVENGNTKYDSRGNCNAIIETNNNQLIFGCKNTIIPSGVRAIGNSAFYNCYGLTELTIPNSVTSIGDAAFYLCQDLTELTLPNSVTSIGNAAFYGCEGLTEFTIPNGVTAIGSSTFYFCYGLRKLTIPNSVTTIGKSAFANCTSLTEVTIGNSVYSIGSSAFSGCSKLTTLYSLRTYPPTAFESSFVWSTGKTTYFSAFDDEHYTTVDLFVPEEALAAYQTARIWTEFQNLHAIGSSAVERVSTAAEQIQSANGQIVVTGLTDGTTVAVYDLGGQQIGSTVSKGGQAAVNTGLTTGAVAVVKMGERSVKVTMK